MSLRDRVLNKKAYLMGCKSMAINLCQDVEKLDFAIEVLESVLNNNNQGE